MKNFERLKSLDSEYEMTDLIMYAISTHYSEIIKGDGTLEGLSLLRWLQKEHEESVSDLDWLIENVAKLREENEQLKKDIKFHEKITSKYIELKSK